MIKVYTMREALQEFGGLPDDLLSGIIGTETTIFFGASGVGKGRLLAEIIASGLCGRPFAGREWSRPVRRVAVIGTDAGAPREYAKWVKRAGVGIEHENNLRIWGVNQALSDQEWKEVAAGVVAFDPTLVIVDSTTEIIQGSVNDDTSVRSFWRSCAPIREAEIPLTMVHHVAKAGPDSGGRVGSTPMGSSLWENFSRNKVNVHARAGQVVMACRPRHSGKWEALFDENPDSGRLTHASTSDAKAIRERKQSSRDNQASKNEDIASWIVANCQGKNQSQVSRELAEKFGGPSETYRRKLNTSGKIGALVTGDQQNQWSRVGS